MLDKQAVQLVIDFGELPVFEAATFPAIFIWQKQPRNVTPTKWAVVKNLQACYEEGIREHVTRIAETIPASQFGEGKSRLTSLSIADRRTKMEASGQRLGQLVEGQILYGIKTGLNEAFIIDQVTNSQLIEEDSRNTEIIKPLLSGDDVRGYEIHFRETFLLYMYHNVDIRLYPAAQRYLKPFRSKLERRATRQEWYELQQPSVAYIPVFNGIKIIYPEIAKEPRFALDTIGFYPNKTVFSIPSNDWYLLGVLNSDAAWSYLKATCSVLGDEEKGGRLTLQAIYLETLPIPDAPTAERNHVAKLAQQAQELHTKRRKRVEKFLRDIGTSPAESSSRNPLEQVWSSTADEFARRAPHAAMRLFTDARDETAALTEHAAKVELEIDERVAALYGL